MKTFIYRHFSGDGSLLYVGASKNPAKRLREHKASPWYADIQTISVEPFESRNEALTAEASAIRNEHPRYNSAHTSESKTQSLFIGFRPTPDVNRRIRAVAKAKGVSTSAVIMWALTAQLPKFEAEISK